MVAICIILFIRYYFYYKLKQVLLKKSPRKQSGQCLLIEVPGGEPLGTGVMKKKCHVSQEEEVGGGWMGAPHPGAGITQGVTPRQGSHEGEGVSQAGREA